MQCCIVIVDKVYLQHTVSSLTCAPICTQRGLVKSTRLIASLRRPNTLLGTNRDILRDLNRNGQVFFVLVLMVLHLSDNQHQKNVIYQEGLP